MEKQRQKNRQQQIAQQISSRNRSLAPAEKALTFVWTFKVPIGLAVLLAVGWILL